ncbi:MAG: hypothetical protein J5527_02490 [Treponema sp.]|nr:hypothetical protein [Treponema sp.]
MVEIFIRSYDIEKRIIKKMFMLRKLKELVLFIFFLCITNLLFGFQTKKISRDVFLSNEFITLVQKSIYGSFSKTRKEFDVLKEENGLWIFDYYFKTGDYYYCIAKAVCPIEDNSKNTILYINDEQLVGDICDIWFNNQWNVKRITIGWDDNKNRNYSALKTKTKRRCFCKS